MGVGVIVKKIMVGNGWFFLGGLRRIFVWVIMWGGLVICWFLLYWDGGIGMFLGVCCIILEGFGSGFKIGWWRGVDFDGCWRWIDVDGSWDGLVFLELDIFCLWLWLFMNGDLFLIICWMCVNEWCGFWVGGIWFWVV